MLKIIGIKAKNGYFVSFNSGLDSWYHSDIDEKLINGKKLLPTYDKDWFLVLGEVKTVEKIITGEKCNFRYEISDKNLVCDKFKEVLGVDEVVLTKNDSTYESDWKWKDEFKPLMSLYEYVGDTKPDYKEKIDFEIETIANLDINLDFQGWRLRVPDIWNGSSYIAAYTTNKEVHHTLLSKISVPSIMIPYTECCISSKQFYKIIREHVKLKIDPRYAEITSDYDFCFTVMKKIGKHRSRNDKNKFVAERTVEMFEMTHEVSKYKGYTIIHGMKGTTEDNLKYNIDKFLCNLMAKINIPLKDCSECKGLGVVMCNND